MHHCHSAFNRTVATCMQVQHVLPHKIFDGTQMAVPTKLLKTSLFKDVCEGRDMRKMAALIALNYVVLHRKKVTDISCQEETDFLTCCASI